MRILDIRRTILRPRMAVQPTAAPATCAALAQGADDLDGTPVAQPPGEASARPNDDAVRSARTTTPRTQDTLSSSLKEMDHGAIIHFLLNTSVGNAVTILGFVVTVISLVWALFVGITGYRDMIWSRHNNAIQACASLYVRCANPMSLRPTLTH